MEQSDTPRIPAVAREHSRTTCKIGGFAIPTGSAEDGVRLSSSRAGSDGTFPVTIVDLSPGGMSLVTEVFLPRGCELEVRVADAGARRGGTLLGQVRNVSMSDRTPRYRMGVRLQADEASQSVIEGLLKLLSDNGDGTCLHGAEVGVARA